MTSAHQRAAQMLAASADFLDQGQVANRLSIAATAIALGVLLVPLVPASEATQPAAAAVAILGAIELFLAAKVGLCAAQFRRLANDAAAERLDIAAFDAALVTLKFIMPAKAGRTIAKRFAGARRFLIAQVAALLLQIVVSIAGGYAAVLNAI